MTKVQGMTDFMHLNRQISTPPIAVHRQPTVHVGIGDAGHGIFRKTIHGKVCKLSRVLDAEDGVESPRDFISHRGISLGDAREGKGDRDHSVGKRDDVGIVGTGYGGGGFVIESHLVPSSSKDQFVVTARLHLRHDIRPVVDAGAENAVAEIRFVEGRLPVRGDDSNDDDRFRRVKVGQVPPTTTGRRILPTERPSSATSMAFLETTGRQTLQIGGSVRKEFRFVGYRDGGHS